MRKFIIGLTLISFIWGSLLPPAFAQGVFLPAAQVPITLTAAYTPCQLRGIKIDPQDPFKLDFVVEEGDSGLKREALQDESRKLIKYFLATVTTPESDLWVNLSPYEDNRIIQEDFGRTAMGRDLLAQDYILKQITATLMHPDNEAGKQFWAEVYKQSFNKFGTTDIPIDTFNKVWIVPQNADIYESDDTANQRIGAYIDSARLKVMLESDYLASSMAEVSGASAAKTGRLIEPSSDGIAVQKIIREIIIPVLEKEVNEGRNFALLRQVYHSLLLATWFKKKLKSAVLMDAPEEKKGMVRGNPLALLFLNQHKTGGLETIDPKNEIRSIYDRYVEAFKDGAYNIIREDYDIYSQELIPRKYFTGGFNFSQDIVDSAMNVKRGVPRAKPWTFQGGIFGLAIILKVEVNSKRANILSFHLLKNTAGKTSFLIYTNRSVFFKTLGALVVVAAVASYSLGSYLNHIPSDLISSIKSTVIEKFAEKPLVDGLVTKPIISIEKSENKTFNGAKIEQTLNDVIDAIESYENGNLHRKKGNIDGLHVKRGSVAQALNTLLIPGPTPEIQSQALAGIMNEVIPNLTESLIRIGMTEEEIADDLFGISAKESGLDMKLRLVKDDKITARAVSQFQRTTYLSALTVAKRILKEKTSQGVDTFTSFQSRVEQELAREQSNGMQNYWPKDDPNNMLDAARSHFTLMGIWYNQLVNAKPITVNTELSRLDTLYFGSRAEVEKWTNPELTIEEVLSLPIIKDNYSDKDQKRLARNLVSLAWNIGNNISTQVRLYAVKYFFSNMKQRVALTKQAGNKAYTHFVYKVTAQAALEKELGADFGFNPASDKREEMLKKLKQFLKNEPMDRSVAITMRWYNFRKEETDFNNEFGKFKIARATHPLFLSALHSPDKMYEFGLENRRIQKIFELYEKILRREMKVAQDELLTKPAMQGSSKNTKSSINSKTKSNIKRLSDGSLAKPLDVDFAQVFILPGDDNDMLSMLNKVSSWDLDQVMGVVAKDGLYQNLDAIQISETRTMDDIKGGIDLQTAAMDFNIVGNAGNFQFDISKERLESLRSTMNGLEPLIISVEPISNVPMFLGLTPQTH